jgi:diacylglycerol O-acyltransferase / wax synthase
MAVGYRPHAIATAVASCFEEETVMPHLIDPASALFLLAENRTMPLHVGALQLFEKPDGAGPDYVREVAGRMRDVSDVSPLFLRRPYRPIRSAGHLAWQEDPRFDIDHHVRHSALIRPGRYRELFGLCGRLHSTPLPRDRPLWEAHVIEGLANNKFAIYVKMHHSLVDGIRGMRLMEASLSPDPADRDTRPMWERTPVGRSKEDPVVLRGAAGPSRGASRQVRDVVSDVSGMPVAAGRTLVSGVRRETSSLAWGAPRTMLNQTISGSRRFAADDWAIERLRAIAVAAGASLNDVVLAMCSGALRAYMIEADALPRRSMVAMVPVGLKTKATSRAADGGNAIGTLMVRLATDTPDPAERLQRIHHGMATGKKALSTMTPAQVVAVAAWGQVPVLAPPLLGLQGVASPACNLIISNVPGPRTPLYMNGARLTGTYPLSLPMHGLGLNITCVSYDGQMSFGLTGCRRTVPHLQRLLANLDHEVGALERALGI